MAFDPCIPDETNPETKPFWEGTRAGKFLMRRCPACARTHWYPRAICPHCFSAETEWFEASGDGEIYSFTIFRAAATPEVMAYVELAEGPRILTTIEATDPEALSIEQSVRVVLQTRPSGPPIPVFRPS